MDEEYLDQVQLSFVNKKKQKQLEKNKNKVDDFLMKYQKHETNQETKNENVFDSNLDGLVISASEN